MNYYKLGYDSYEDSHYETLTHDTKFSKDELEDMIAEGFKSLFPSACMQNRTHIYEFFIDNTINIYDWLINNKGFKKLEYTAVSSIFGWSDLMDSNAWEGEHRGNSLYPKILHKIESEVNDETYTDNV